MLSAICVFSAHVIMVSPQRKSCLALRCRFSNDCVPQLSDNNSMIQQIPSFVKGLLRICFPPAPCPVARVSVPPAPQGKEPSAWALRGALGVGASSSSSAPPLPLLDGCFLFLTATCNSTRKASAKSWHACHALFGCGRDPGIAGACGHIGLKVVIVTRV